MKGFLSIAAMLLGLIAYAAMPPTTLSVSNPDPMVTETWTAKIEFFIAPLEGRHAATCPIARSSSPLPSFFQEDDGGIALHGFPVEGVRFSHSIGREKKNGVNYWRVTLVSDPIPAARPGRIDVGPLTVEARLIGRIIATPFGPEFNTYIRRFTTPRVTVTVSEPPRDGRPDAYCGAIGSNITAVARLDTNICTAGDPLILTMTVSGASDPSVVRPPAVESAIEKGGVFRVDAESVKSRIDGNSRVFTWRIRACKAGTVEFPSVPVAFFDIRSRSYRTLQTESIPVQVKAGAQVALGLSDTETEGEGEFPMPDGIDLDFPDSGTAAFTFKRAVSLIGRAVEPADFAAAAKAYEEYLSQLPEEPLAMISPLKTPGGKDADRLSRHCANLGALRLLGGDARGALDAYSQASAFAGDNPSMLRGIKAARARLMNDPRADLPVTRILFPFWFRMKLWLRIVACVATLFVLGFVWWLAGRLGRGRVLVLAAAFMAVSAASAQWPFRSARSFMHAGSTDVKASISLEPAETVVGEPSAFVFSFDVENGVDVERLDFRGLPALGYDEIEYGSLERMPDAVSSTRGHVVRRVKIPVRFLAPFTGEVKPVAMGMLVTRRGNGTSFSFTSSVNFSTRCAPMQVSVEPLPEEGRPADFTGAIGKNFRLLQKLTPSRVHPGDLVTAEYTLTFNGYFPTNVLPKIEGLGGEFKVYEPKEKSRTSGAVVWRQMLVPQSPAATNAASLAVVYYDVAAKRYATARAPAGRLEFVSKEAASTENTSVLVDAHAAGAAQAPSKDGAARQITLHFAPSGTSPVVAVLPPGTEVKTLSRHGGWLRVETPRAIGWTNYR